MGQQKVSSERVSLFSDGVFAVIITILVLDLKVPATETFSNLLSLWPTGLSYAISYFFVAIVWVNHHHLFRFADTATYRLIWVNFAHLFMVSLVPFSTSWMAKSHLAAVPTALYATVFVLVNATYIGLCWEAVHRSPEVDVPENIRNMMRMRSIATLILFAVAAGVSLISPFCGIALISICLLLYLRP
ncbi:TMEM175 family protein [Undibacterium sp. TJN25]|uniref:TMEM175 family protein n=1 Tax=Undibacterium sp. TJN25 TaxID=3413056 RepID=UPI003BEF7626